MAKDKKNDKKNDRDKKTPAREKATANLVRCSICPGALVHFRSLDVHYRLYHDAGGPEHRL